MAGKIGMNVESVKTNVGIALERADRVEMNNHEGQYLTHQLVELVRLHRDLYRITEQVKGFIVRDLQKVRGLSLGIEHEDTAFANAFRRWGD